MTATVQLPEHGGIIHLTSPATDPYCVKTEPGEWLLLIMGSTKPMPANSTANAIRCITAQFEFKHSRRDGSKSWTSQDGWEYPFAVRKADLALLDKQTCSYPVLVLPGGEQITTNVSGGSTPTGGWCDFLPNITHTCVNHPSAVWQALNAIAVKHGSPYDDYQTFAEREARFYAENRGRWMGVSASRSEQYAGLTEVTCAVDASRDPRARRRTFLVPQAQYQSGGLPWVLPEPNDFRELA